MHRRWWRRCAACRRDRHSPPPPPPPPFAFLKSGTWRAVLAGSSSSGNSNRAVLLSPLTSFLAGISAIVGGWQKKTIRKGYDAAEPFFNLFFVSTSVSSFFLVLGPRVHVGNNATRLLDSIKLDSTVGIWYFKPFLQKSPWSKTGLLLFCKHGTPTTLTPPSLGGWGVAQGTGVGRN